MDTHVVTVELPANIYDKLQELASAEQSEPVALLNRLISLAYQQQSWRQEVSRLREEIQQVGGLSVGSDKEAVIERLRQTRREIFDAEYAHLY